jgi:mannose-6-phosphate isomerase-like protein (cupin superfamily)
MQSTRAISVVRFGIEGKELEVDAEMREAVIKSDREAELFTPERCYILEMSNSEADPGVSIARARVEPGITTALHRLEAVEERYIVLEGVGRMEVGDLEPVDVEPGAVVLVPAGTRQRITNTGDRDLIFLCVCTPRFYPGSYEDIEG